MEQAESTAENESDDSPPTAKSQIVFWCFHTYVFLHFVLIISLPTAFSLPFLSRNTSGSDLCNAKVREKDDSLLAHQSECCSVRFAVFVDDLGVSLSLSSCLLVLVSLNPSTAPMALNSRIPSTLQVLHLENRL